MNAGFATRIVTAMDCYIFDLDGTLVDSEPACSQALLDLLPELTDSLPALVRLFRGRKLSDIFDNVETKIGRSLPIDFEQAYRSRVADIFQTELRVVPGATEVLTTIDRPVCVASNGPRSKIQHALDLTGLSRFFGENIFSSYDVGSWKPNPRLFLHAAEAMGAAPGRCIVVEDSETGIAAAVSAGMHAIHYLPDGDLMPAKGAIKIRHLRELLSVSFQTDTL